MIAASRCLAIDIAAREAQGTAAQSDPGMESANEIGTVALGF